MEKIKLILDALEAVNLKDIVIYDMREKSPFFDYLVISSATSDRQLGASVSHIQKGLTENGFNTANVEGKNSNSWILIDCKDIVVNVFTKDEREHYNIEKMFADMTDLDIDTLREL